MIEKLTDLKKKRVLIIGDIILDHYINIIPNKISAEAPLVVFNYNNEYYSLGGAANVAKYLANFSCIVDLLGVIGNDNNAKVVISELKKNHIKIDKIIRCEDSVTTTKTRLYSNDNKQVLRYDNENNNTNYNKLVIDMINSIRDKYDLIIISDYNKGVISNEVFNKIVDIASINNIKIICDPKSRLINYKNIYLLKPNIKEIIDIVGSSNDKDIINYKKNNNIENIVLTLGNEGMKIYLKDNNIIEIKAYKSMVYDVTGAGDCVLAYIALGLLTDMNFIEICNMANYAASIKVSKFGTELVNIEEIIPFFNKKVIDRKYIKDLCRLIKNTKKIVFTNGCFDIIHSGHIHTLKEAKSYGDVLIIGLNSDSSIKKLKGNNRPILKEEERIDILSSLEFVDYIVLFDEDTPLKLVKDIKPDVLVKGSDYKNKYIAGRKEVEERGGKVVLVDLVDGKSTTSIIERIKEKVL